MNHFVDVRAGKENKTGLMISGYGFLV